MNWPLLISSVLTCLNVALSVFVLSLNRKLIKEKNALIEVQRQKIFYLQQAVSAFQARQR
jgi:hypothetical protein